MLDKEEADGDTDDVGGLEVAADVGREEGRVLAIVVLDRTTVVLDTSGVEMGVVKTEVVRGVVVAVVLVSPDVVPTVDSPGPVIGIGS